LHRPFDHLVRPEQHRLRDHKTDLLGGFKIDHQLELRGLLDWQLRWIGAFQDLINISGGAPVQVHKVRCIGYETPGLDELARWVDRREPTLCRQLHKTLPAKL
jgi:hypothetical protein